LLLNVPQTRVGRCFAPVPNRGAYSTALDPLAGFGEDPGKGTGKGRKGGNGMGR